MPARSRYSLPEIQAHALALVDRDGPAGLTMRALAARLGTGPMTLYNYVRDRDELEELVVAGITESIVIPPTTDDWAADVRAVAHAVRAATRAHPAAIPLILTRRTSSPAAYRPAEALIAALERGGIEGHNLLVAFRTILGYVMGAAQAEHASPLDAERIGAVAGTDHPHLAALAQVARRSDPKTEFDAGLTILLRGLHTP
jgi:AcrR family transcriptional regulator